MLTYSRQCHAPELHVQEEGYPSLVVQACCDPAWLQGQPLSLSHEQEDSGCWQKSGTLLIVAGEGTASSARKAATVWVWVGVENEVVLSG
jgi:hypothetical protein